MKWRKRVDYSKMPNPIRKDNQERINTGGSDYCSREDDCSSYWIWGKKGRWICKDCLHSQDNMSRKCTKCGSGNVKQLITCARVPKKNSNKSKWKNFIKNFVK